MELRLTDKELELLTSLEKAIHDAWTALSAAFTPLRTELDEQSQAWDGEPEDRESLGTFAYELWEIESNYDDAFREATIRLNYLKGRWDVGAVKADNKE